MFKWFFDWLTHKKRLKNLLIAIDKIGIKNYLVSGDDLRKVMNLYEPGDALLIYAFGEASSLLQFSEFSHVAIGSDKEKICEAIGTGVQERDILNLFTGISRICIRRPRSDKEKRHRILEKAKKFISLETKYDWSFKEGEKALYCSEYYYYAFDHVFPKTLGLRERFGRKTITPDDIFKADEYFETIFDSGQSK